MSKDLDETRTRKDRSLRDGFEMLKGCELKLILNALRSDTTRFSENIELRHMVNTVIRCGKFLRVKDVDNA